MTVISSSPAVDARQGASVRLTGITMAYGGNAPAVDGVDLDIEPGQFVTLLGASGSGKTTLLRIIAGYQRATSGTLFVDGSDIGRLPVYQRGIGMVFQNYALFPHMTVAKNIAFPLEMAGITRAKRPALVEEALAQVHLSGFGHRKPAELSGGQQQRVALARAIVAKPRLLLMDEPLGALDRRLRENLQVEMRRLSRDLGLTVVNVTHDQEEALTMSDRIALLIGGRIAQYGSAEDLYDRPASAAVGDFLGESNMFTGDAGADGSVACEGGTVYAGERTAGERTTVMVRSNKVVLAAPDAVATLPARTSWVPTQVVTSLFAGDSRKIVAETASGHELVARLDPTHPPVADGSAVLFTWPEHDARVLPND